MLGDIRMSPLKGTLASWFVHERYSTKIVLDYILDNSGMDDELLSFALGLKRTM